MFATNQNSRPARPSANRLSTARVAALAFTSLAVFLIVSYAVAIKWVAPKMLSEKLTSGVADACKTCDLKIGSIQTSFFSPGHLIASDIHFKGGDPKTTAVLANIGELEMTMALLPLRHRKIEVQQLSLKNPYIELQDGTEHSPPSHSPQVVSLPVQFEVQKTTVSNGAFRYVSQQKKLGRSRLEFTKINGESDAIGNTPALLHTQTHSHLVGVNTEVLQTEKNPPPPEANVTLEKSESRVEVDLRANYLVQPYRENVKFVIHQHSLKPMGVFLDKNDGIRVSGWIREAQATIDMNGRHVHGVMTSEYKNLKVAILPTAERSSFSAGLMQLAVKLAVHESTDKEKAAAQEARVTEAKKNQKVASITDTSPLKTKKTLNSNLGAPSTYDAPAQDGGRAASPAKDLGPSKVDTKREEYESVAHAIIRTLKEVSIQSVIESHSK